MQLCFEQNDTERFPSLKRWFFQTLQSDRKALSTGAVWDNRTHFFRRFVKRIIIRGEIKVLESRPYLLRDWVSGLFLNKFDHPHEGWIRPSGLSFSFFHWMTVWSLSKFIVSVVFQQRTGIFVSVVDKGWVPLACVLSFSNAIIADLTLPYESWFAISECQATNLCLLLFPLAAS